MGAKFQGLGVIAISILIYSVAAFPAPLAPEGLTVEDRISPIGIGDATPEFAWEVRNSEPGAEQKAYQILVASSAGLLRDGATDRWDTGRRDGSRVAYVAYEGTPLGSREICWWTVRTWDAEGRVSAWAAPARFELGLLEHADWGVQWIWRPWVEGNEHVYFRKVFDLSDASVERARVYVTAMHHFRLYVDGALVGWGPALTDPEFQQYRTFDIGPFLKPGTRHVIGLRCHWFDGGQGRPPGRPGLLLKTVIDQAGGTTVVFGSDASWKSREAEWVLDEDVKPFRNGEGIPWEGIDGRLQPVGWELLEYDESNWDAVEALGTHPAHPWTGTLIAQDSEIDEYSIAPTSSTRHGNRILIDFGNVYVGRPHIHFTGAQRGDAFEIKADYRLETDGTVDAFAQNTRMDYRYRVGGDGVFEPFWYLGYRYLQIAPLDAAAELRLDNATAVTVVRHNKAIWASSAFDCSYTLLNDVWRLAKRSVLFGSQEGFIDTPTREQGQFTYDSFQTSLAAMRLFRERDLTQKGLRDFAISQIKYHADTGKVNAVYPYESGRDIPDWTQSWVLWAWAYYRETGDLGLIGEIFPQLVRAGEYCKNSENPTTGLIDWGNAEGYESGIVDWPDRYDYDMTTTQRTVLSCNAWAVYQCVTGLADALGRSEEARRFDAWAKDIANAINTRLWDGKQEAYVDGLYADGSQSPHASQQANAVAIAMGIAPAERVEGALREVKSAGHRTAPMLAWLLVRCYGETDSDDALYEYLQNQKGRNWAHILADGGSFTYEAWRISGPEANERVVSESHPVGALGAVLALQEYVLGVQIIEPQAKRIKIRPHPGKLVHARGIVPTQQGAVEIDWKRDAFQKEFWLSVNIPANMRADVYLPADGRTNEVELDGEIREVKPAGKYLLVESVGSGDHVIWRR